MAHDIESLRVLLVEPNTPLRSAILDILSASRIAVDPCDSLDEALVKSTDGNDCLALVAWQMMGGLLADEHRNHLVKLTNSVRLVVMVPRRWARLLDATDLGAVVAGIVPKPFEADELLEAIRTAMFASSTSSAVAG